MSEQNDRVEDLSGHADHLKVVFGAVITNDDSRDPTMDGTLVKHVPAVVSLNGGNAGGEDAMHLLMPDRSMHLAATIAGICELQVRRVFYIRRINMLDNSVRALARRALGWRFDMPEKERAKINANAAKLVKSIQDEDDITDDAGVAEAISLDVMVCAAARVPLANARRRVENEMKKCARALPVWKWAEGIDGLGELGLAVIVGETGDLALYATPSRVWKRLGLAVINGERQRKKATAEEAAAHGYSPRRRAEIWSCVGDPLFRAQSQRINKETGELIRPAGPYRELYDREKIRFIAEGKATRPAHAHAHGTRLMTKRLIADLWEVWNGRNVCGRIEADGSSLDGGTSETVNRREKDGKSADRRGCGL